MPFSPTETSPTAAVTASRALSSPAFSAGGAPPPPQVNPYKVMNEPTVDRMVPFYKGVDLNAQLENDQEVERLTKKGRKQVCTEVPSGEQVCADVAS